MGSTNLGNQTLTFDFKQAGTSEGFNKLMYNLVPRGLFYGGEIVTQNNTTATIEPFLSFFEDTNKRIGVRLETSSVVNVTISPTTPYVIGRFNWLNIDENYMDFISVSAENINSTDIIFGKIEYNAMGVTTGVDFSKKSYSKTYYESTSNRFTNYNYYPSFHVSFNENNTSTVLVGVGKAYINGKLVELTSQTTSPAIDINVTNNRIDLVVINENSQIEIIKGEDSESSIVPQCPSNKLIVARLNLDAESKVRGVLGSQIEYIYNNNSYLNSTLTDNTVSTNKLQDESVTSQKLNSDVDTRVFDLIYPIGVKYEQYPTFPSPNELWGTHSTWEKVDFGGAFFRAEGGQALPFTSALKGSFDTEGTVFTLDTDDTKTMATQEALKDIDFATMIVIIGDKTYEMFTWDRGENKIVFSNPIPSYSSIDSILVGQNDAFQGHEHSYISGYLSYTGGFGNGTKAYVYNQRGNTDTIIEKQDYGTPRYDTETRSKNLTYIIWKRIS